MGVTEVINHIFNRLMFLLIDSDNPWDYLAPKTIAEKIEKGIENGPFWSGLYVTLRLVGITGAVVTLAIAFAKLASAGPEKRNELKDTIFKKLLIIAFLFLAAFIFGTVLGVFLLL